MPARLRVSDAASGEEDLSLVRPQLDADRGLRAAREIFHDRIAASTNRREQVRDPEAVPLLDFVVTLRVREGDGRDTRVHQVVHVDSREALREDQVPAQEYRCDRGVLQDATVAAVRALDDGLAVPVLR